MELALLVYAISLLPRLHTSTGLVMVLCAAGLGLTGFIIGVFGSYSDGFEEWWGKFKPAMKGFVPIFLLASLVNILLPTEKTAYTMVGAYAAQKIATDPRTVEVSGKVMTIINQKLDYYVKEGADELEKQVKPKKSKD